MAAGAAGAVASVPAAADAKPWDDLGAKAKKEKKRHRFAAAQICKG